LVKISDALTLSQKTNKLKLDYPDRTDNVSDELGYLLGIRIDLIGFRWRLQTSQRDSPARKQSRR